ncbi:metallophosphoesterase [Halobacillus campisalis]|uniref:Metallophosphoesterase n=1 Tax=Halobacillus campisalis TaxID=435909 RepID=A0ABW2K7G1_9BACI|nr:metallophosphoesterase [Halobacillus campisalis]
MKKVVRKMIFGIVILATAITTYTIWDNQRIKVVEQTVAIENLPIELEGVSILQITDLHEKVFGTEQEKLIKAINSVDYDVIAFTGDMLNGTDSRHYESFYTLLEGIENKKHALYVPGNADPESYFIDAEGNYVKDEFVEGLEERGVKLLEAAYNAEFGETSIRFDAFEVSVLNPEKGVVVANGRVRSKYAKTTQYRNHQQRLMSEIAELNETDHDLLIALNHYPVVDARMDQLIDNPQFIWRDYDLIVAGHYHGGQIRVPFIGALFVPEPWYKGGGILPPRDRVSGLWDYHGTKQYVSRGLGSSNFISFLKFRMFNTPEINVLTFKSKK